ncbi:hypothetical protein MNBD_NITROSPINAE02-1415 [hydrothermal vent metagenome]|uniref:Uncharacterized protein n=1 Tax=hydrothermal vent metagenome TaxID=652676 RepID=A0A3B1BVN2_9ZZZZ
MAYYKTFAKTCLLIALALAGSSCQSGEMSVRRAKGVTVSPAPDTLALHNVKKIVVLDFHEHQAEITEGDPNICPVTGFHFISGFAPAGSGVMVADQLRLALVDKGFDVIHRKILVEALKDMPELKHNQYTAALGADIGRRMGADVVMMGSVMRFEELVGTKIAAEKPAAVGLSLAVINPADGKILWKAKFEKVQHALLLDVLDYETFFAGGMVWQRASQLSHVGITNLLQRLPIRSAR